MKYGQLVTRFSHLHRKWRADKPTTAEREKMSTKIMRRIENRQERKIIMEFAETRGWDYDEDLIENLCEAFEDYEDYREWYLMMVA